MLKIKAKDNRMSNKMKLVHVSVRGFSVQVLTIFRILFIVTNYSISIVCESPCLDNFTALRAA